MIRGSCGGNGVINAVRFHHTPDITVINQRQYDAHNTLYKGYVSQINKITEELSKASAEVKKDANTTNGLYRGLKRGETYALNGVILHELYFRNIGGLCQSPSKEILDLFQTYFGGYDCWKEDFIATAKCSRGWAILAYDQRCKMLRNISLDDHDTGEVVLSLPILVLDMYEHAYMIQYGIEKMNYINAFIENIHWDILSQRVMHYQL